MLHRYHDDVIPIFLATLQHVLRKGGHFLYVSRERRGGMALLGPALELAGFTLLSRREAPPEYRRNPMPSATQVPACACVCARARARACVCVCVRARAYVFVVTYIVRSLLRARCTHARCSHADGHWLTFSFASGCRTFATRTSRT